MALKLKKCPHCDEIDTQERIYLNAISNWTREDDYPNVGREDRDMAHYRCVNCGLVSIIAWEEKNGNGEKKTNGD